MNIKYCPVEVENTRILFLKGLLNLLIKQISKYSSITIDLISNLKVINFDKSVDKQNHTFT